MSANDYYIFMDLYDILIFSFLPFVAGWSYSLFKKREAKRIRIFLNLLGTNLVKYTIPFICCLYNKNISFNHPMSYTFLVLGSGDIIMLFYWGFIGYKY